VFPCQAQRCPQGQAAHRTPLYIQRCPSNQSLRSTRLPVSAAIASGCPCRSKTGARSIPANPVASRSWPRIDCIWPKAVPVDQDGPGAAGERHAPVVDRRTFGLTPDALKRSEQPRTEPGLFTDPQQQRILNVYADFYAATITAVEESEETLPTLRDVARETPHRMLDMLAAPLDSLPDEKAEPSWTPITERIRETDARARLAGLLAKLRRPTRTPDIRTRLAEAGTDYRRRPAGQGVPGRALTTQSPTRRLQARPAF